MDSAKKNEKKSPDTKSTKQTCSIPISNKDCNGAVFLRREKVSKPADSNRCSCSTQ